MQQQVLLVTVLAVHRGSLPKNSLYHRTTVFQNNTCGKTFFRRKATQKQTGLYLSKQPSALKTKIPLSNKKLFAHCGANKSKNRLLNFLANLFTHQPVKILFHCFKYIDLFTYSHQSEQCFPYSYLKSDKKNIRYNYFHSQFLPKIYRSTPTPNLHFFHPIPAPPHPKFKSRGPHLHHLHTASPANSHTILCTLHTRISLNLLLFSLASSLNCSTIYT